MPRVGLMGCGSVAHFGHIPAILQTPGLDLVALFDPVAGRASATATEFGVALGTTIEEEFFSQALDVVVIASPPVAHLANAVAAAERGAHVLCEKPLSVDEEQSVELARLVRAKGREVWTGFVYRFSPVAVQIREWVRAGTVGDIRALRLIYDWNLHGRYVQDESGAWVESRQWAGRMEEGGPLVDCGVHQIDLARWWLGSEVVDFSAAGAWVTNYEAPDHVYVHLRHENGALTTVETSFSLTHTAREPWSIFSYHLIGDGGVLRYEREGYVLEARHGQGTIHLPGASEKNFPGMYEALLRTLETGEDHGLASAEDGIVATRIARSATDRLIAQQSGTS